MRFTFFLLCLIQSLLGKPLDIELKARHAILMNAKTGKILFEKEAHLLAYPASTTKIATALYILDSSVDLSEQAQVTKECLRGRPEKGWEDLPPYWLDPDGVMMGLKVGEVLSLETLLHGLMLISGNDAANVLAAHIGGTVPQFMEKLNEYLQELGCKRTYFCNPHGLSHPEHRSSAYDLACITKKALSIPKFRQIVSTLQYQKPATNKQPSSELKLTNSLMKPESRYYYPKAIGVKTGYTHAAQYNLVAAAEQEERTLIAVLLGCPGKADRFEDAKKLFEAAFQESKRSRRLVGPENVFKRQIDGSKKVVKASLLKPLTISFFPSEEPSCKAILQWNSLSLPIAKGQKVGEIHILDEQGILLERGDLLSLEALKSTFLYSLRKKLFR